MNEVTPQMYKLYCDLDGVLAAFDDAVLKLTGKLPNQQTDGEMWKVIDTRATDIYLNLDWEPGGEVMWDYIRRYQPTILTGLPSSIKRAADDKRQWCARHLGKYVPVITCLAKDKHKYANEYSILIDDRIKNITDWKAAGGIGILHNSRSPQSTIKALRDLGL